jgi:ribosomal protein S18 acetylase RimI-like enzyme
MILMLDKSIPYKNLLMKCTKINENALTSLPDGYTFKMYRDGDEGLWADIELSIGEFEFMTREQVEDYFIKEYFGRKEKLYERCIFALDLNNIPVGTCMAWHDLKDSQEVASVHWLAVKPSAQSNGIGRALLAETMRIFTVNGENPVYLHTQPWSYKAIKLYMDFGFHALKSESFSDFINEFEVAVRILENYLNQSCFHRLIDTAD